MSWIDDAWYATGSDGRKRGQGSGGGRGHADRVTAGELMAMSPEERRAFMEQEASGLPMPANFEAIEVHDQVSDAAAQAIAEYLRTLQMAVGMNVAAVPPVVNASALIATKAGVAFKHGTIFEKPIETAQGPVDMLAEVVVSGKTLILKDVAIFGRSPEPMKGVLREVLGAKTELMNAARKDGFERLVLQGIRHPMASTSAKPGKVVEITIDLMR